MLSSRSLRFCALALALVVCLTTTSDALQTYVQRLPNGASVRGVRALGHVNLDGGGANNAFGEAFAAAGTQWTTALCEADTDGDGATNGEELGDPCCTWQPGTFASRTSALSHPGIVDAFAPTELAAMGCQPASAQESSRGTTDQAADADVATVDTLPPIAAHPVTGNQLMQPPPATTGAPKPPAKPEPKLEPKLEPKPTPSPKPNESEAAAPTPTSAASALQPGSAFYPVATTAAFWIVAAARVE